MRREEVLRILHEHRDEITSFGVKSLSLFGSVARNEATLDSDVDVLVEFAVPVGLFQFIRLQQFLENLLGTRVDLTTVEGLRETMREQVLKEAVRAA